MLEILIGILRYAVTAFGTTLVAHAVQIVDGLPQVHNLVVAAAGGALVVAGGVASAIGNIKKNTKTESGPIYKTNT